MRRSHASSVVALPVVALSLVLLAGMGVQAYPTPAQQCRATKNKLAGQYAACRQNAEARVATTNNAAGYTRALAKCASKFGSAWQKASDRAAASGAPCSDAPLAGGDFQTLIDEQSQNIGIALLGGGLFDCPADLGTCNGDLAACEGDLGTCTEYFGTCMDGLATCNWDLATCQDDLATRTGDLTACEGARDTCQNDLALCASGACGNATIEDGEDCDIENLNEKTCVTQGFAAGKLLCGAGCTFDTSLCSPTRFRNLGSTVLDIQTGLEWEKKFDFYDPDFPHDVTMAYTWGDLPGCSFAGCPNGTVFTDFLGRIEASCRADPGFPSDTHGECGWRLPTAQELTTIVDLAAPGCGTYPHTCIDPIFGLTSPDGCYVSSTNAPAPQNVLGIQFSDGAVVSVQKALSWFVRAVRNGPVAAAA